jgi:hypothetical protein
MPRRDPAIIVMSALKSAMAGQKFGKRDKQMDLAKSLTA